MSAYNTFDRTGSVLSSWQLKRKRPFVFISELKSSVSFQAVQMEDNLIGSFGWLIKFKKRNGILETQIEL